MDRTPSISAILNLCDPSLFGFVWFLNIRGTKVKSKQFDFQDGRGDIGVHTDILMDKKGKVSLLALNVKQARGSRYQTGTRYKSALIITGQRRSLWVHADPLSL